MELHQLRYFLAVARRLHFGKAAQDIPISPSTLSQQIQKLEEELGAKLFDRLPRSIRLTPAGEAFVAPARRILAEVRAAYDVMQPHAKAPGTDINLGILSPVGAVRLYRSLKEFMDSAEALNFHVFEHWSTEMPALLRAGKLHAAIFSAPAHDDDMELLPFFSESAHVVLPKNHPLAHEESIGLEQIRDEPFILPSREHLVHGLLLEACAGKNVRLNVRQTATQLSTLFNSVADGCGITVAFYAAASPYINVSLTTRLLTPELRRTVGLVFPKDSVYRDIFTRLYKQMQHTFSIEAI